MIVYYDPFDDAILLRYVGWNLFESANFPGGNLYIPEPYRGGRGFGPKLIKLGWL